MKANSQLLKVLHVEDNRTDVLLIRSLLQNMAGPGVSIDNSASLNEAIECAAGNTYDIVLLDLTLPDSEGLATLESFHERFSSLPIILLSGVETDEIIQQAVSRGAQDYLIKGNIKKDMLIRTIRYAIERKQNEHKLKASYERFRLIVEGTSDGIWDWQDITQDQQYWSPRLKALLGYADDAVEGSYSLMLQLIHPDDKANVRQVIKEQFKRGHRFNLEFRMKTQHDGYRWFRTKGKTLVDHSGQPVRVIGSISDVTRFKQASEEQARLQTQLQQAQKLEAVGQLAAGVAHEINTPIQFVSDHLQFLEDAQKKLQSLVKDYQQVFAALPIEEQYAKLAETIRVAEQQADLDFVISHAPKSYATITDGLQRVTTIVKAMQRFAQPDDGNKSLVDVNQAIEDIIVVAGNIWQGNAVVNTRLAPDLPKILVSSAGLSQVLLNIIVNASQAIASRRQMQPQHKGLISIGTCQQEQTIKITVSDNGAGIPENIRHRVFEPFFTTRDVGQGLGQGLSQAYTIVTEQHQGRLWFDSQSQQGTRFYITLPLPMGTATAEHKYA